MMTEAATKGVLHKKLFLKILQNSQENTCARVSYFNKVACNFIKIRDSGTQAFSCEFCEVFKNTFFCRTHLVDCFCNELSTDPNS